MGIILFTSLLSCNSISFESPAFGRVGEADSAILQGFVDNARVGSVGIINVLDSLFALGDNTVTTNILAGWTPQNSVEMNYYHYYNWFLAMADSTKGLTKQDSSDIFTLAYGCPQTDGKVVFAARNLFCNLSHQYFNFPNTCSSNNMRLVKKNIVKTKSIKTDEILVYPNPSKGNVNIKLPVNGRWQITATDITGRVVWQQACDGCNGIIKHEFKNTKGLYFIKIININTGQECINKVLLQE